MMNQYTTGSNITASGSGVHTTAENQNHPSATSTSQMIDNPSANHNNSMDESILDFSELESFSDFLQSHPPPHYHRQGSRDGNDRDRGYSCSDDDLLTNSDQWSSISNMNSVATLTTMTPTLTSTNSHTNNNSNSLSNLRSILEPTPEESGREDSTSRTLSPIQPSSSFHDHNNNSSHHHRMIQMMMMQSPPQQPQPSASLLLEQFHTLQQQQQQQRNSDDPTNNSSNNSSSHFSFLDRDGTFPLPNATTVTTAAAAATIDHSTHMNHIHYSNHYDLTSVSNFHPIDPSSSNDNNNNIQNNATTGFSYGGSTMNRNTTSDSTTGTGSHHLQPQQREQEPQLNSNTNSSNSGIMDTNDTATADPLTSGAMTATSVYTASTIPVQEPNVNDVLLGRGGKNNQWSGNETLREMARTMSTVYSAAPKRNKPAIAMLLVQKIRALTPSGRFLKQEQAVGAWFEVDEEVAREKASQCLRDIVAAVTKMKSVNSMVDCSGNINMSMMTKSSKSTTSLRNASFGGGKIRSSSGHGTSNATFPSSMTTNIPALVSSSSSSATMADSMNHMNSSSSNNISSGLRGSVASFFDHHRNNNKYEASNVLTGISSASRTAAQSGLALLRATSASTTGTKGGFGTASRTLSSSSSVATPIVSNHRQSSNNNIMNAPNSAVASGLGNSEWNTQNRSNSASDNNNNQQNYNSNQEISSMFSMSRLQQGRQTSPTFGVTSSIGSITTGSQSAAARAGLALLQRGSGLGTNTASDTLSNTNMSRVVSNMHSSNNSMRTLPQQQLPSQNLPTRNSFQTGENIGNTSNAMQISSNNLRDMNQTQPQAKSSVANNSNYSHISAHLSTGRQQQQLQSSSRSNSKRNLISASAPNLGDISIFLAKRRRPMENAQWVNNNEGNIPSQNASFADTNNHSNIDAMGNVLEPNQVSDQQQNSTNVSSVGQILPPRAASMISLGANASATGGPAIYNAPGVVHNSHATNDQLLQRFHELRSHMMTTTASIENMAQKNETVRRLSCVREQQESSMASMNFHWNNSIAGNTNSMLDQSLPQADNSGMPTTSRSNNMFASLLQQPRIVNAVTSAPTASSSNHQSLQQQLMSNHNNTVSNASTTHTSNAVNNDLLDFDCFTGLGEAMGDSDDTALQRWIDHMADEELS